MFLLRRSKRFVEKMQILKGSSVGTTDFLDLEFIPNFVEAKGL
jgi:hypothetical protein